MSASQFTVTAVCGVTHIRHVDDTIAGCLAWAAPLREQGWVVDEPEPWTLHPLIDQVKTNWNQEEAA